MAIENDPMTMMRSRIEGITTLKFLFTKDVHSFKGQVDIIIGGSEVTPYNADIYLAKVEITEVNQGQHLCKPMVTYCLKRAYKTIRLGEAGLEPITQETKPLLTGDVYISTSPNHFNAAKSCYIHSFEQIGFVLTTEIDITDEEEGEEDAQVISQWLQFLEVTNNKKDIINEKLLIPHFGDQFLKTAPASSSSSKDDAGAVGDGVVVLPFGDQSLKTGGFFFNKKKTRKRRKKKTRKKKNKKKKTVKKKDIKFTDKTYPYRNISNQEAIDDFLALKRLVQGTINPRSISGNKTVDWGTEKARRKTKYRNKSFVELWDNKKRRKKMLEFAKRLKKIQPRRSIASAIRSAIDLQWGTVNTMRPAAAVQMYKKYKATRVLDFTAGWGARMIAAMALDIDYIGIDTNKALIPGYNRIINLLKPYTKSKVKMIWKEAQKVNYSKLGKYDYVFTSPPYEYLEAYENMTNYENKGSKIKQPSSSQTIKIDDSEKFYDEFLVPTLKKAYKYLPKNKFICLNMPDIMYDKIKKRWKGVTKKETYKIVKRTGGLIGKNRKGKELIFCWKKR